MPNAIESLKAHAAEIGHLRNAMAVLDWDVQVNMPPGGAQARADQLGCLARLSHTQFTSDKTRALLEAAEEEAKGFSLDSDEARLAGNVRHDFDKAIKLPAELAGEISSHATVTEGVWKRARADNDFTAFAPSLKKSFDLTRQVAECLGYEDDLYDPLLDNFEPGMKTAAVEKIFSELKPHLIELTRAISAKDANKDRSLPAGPFPAAVQNEVTLRIVQAIGYDVSRGRQDQAAHPFCTSFSRDDVRITTRFDEKSLEMALYASLHEAGHALYEQGIPAEYDNSPLGGAASMGFHESQSRMWENMVGRSLPFISFVLPKLKKAFPVLSGYSANRFHRAVNRVEPSFIRVEADEVTYNLHIMLRFEMERELLSGRLAVTDAPEAWNARMKEYLGVTPPDHSSGILQDVHWAGVLIGYFPTYALGNLLSAQLWSTVRKSVPDVEKLFECGEFEPLLDWLRENVHHQARRLKPGELIKRAMGEDLSPKYYVDYLKTKYGELYDLKP